MQFDLIFYFKKCLIIYVLLINILYYLVINDEVKFMRKYQK